jgi:hypothetical protein
VSERRKRVCERRESVSEWERECEGEERGRGGGRESVSERRRRVCERRGFEWVGERVRGERECVCERRKRVCVCVCERRKRV